MLKAFLSSGFSLVRSFSLAHNSGTSATCTHYSLPSSPLLLLFLTNMSGKGAKGLSGKGAKVGAMSGTLCSRAHFTCILDAFSATSACVVWWICSPPVAKAFLVWEEKRGQSLARKASPETRRSPSRGPRAPACSSPSVVSTVC